MSKKVIFNGNLGNSFARKRRRMPGTNKKFTPEIKAWDCMNPANTTIGSTDVFEVHEFGNMPAFAEAVPANYHFAWTPLRLQFPQVGATPFNRIGERFLFKYLKLKGYVQVMRRCANPINWRLVMIRWDNAQNAGFNRTTYNSMFKMVPTVPAGYGAEDWGQWSVQAFYNKIKNPDMSSRFKRKVIASGHIPSCFTEQLDNGYINQTTPTTGAYNDETYSYSNQELTGEVAMYMPIDITVTVNDNVDTSINYYLLLEVDVPYGIYSRSEAADAGNARGDWRVLSVLKDQFTIKFFTKGYFEDY